MKAFIYLVPVWLFAMMFPPTLDPQYMDALQIVALIWLPIVGLIVAQGEFLFGPIFSERLSVLFLTTASLVAITASALMSSDPPRSLAYVAAAAVGLISCAGLWRLIGSRIMECISLYAIVGTAFVAYNLVYGPRIQGRLSISLTAHPNYLGLIAFGLLMCSLMVRSRLLAACMMGINIAAIVATESRGSLVAACLGVLVFFTLKITRVHKGRAAFTLTALSLVTALVLIVYRDVIEVSVSSLLFLNDKYRGLGTGFTGRLDAWQEAFDLFLSNPWFGVGFRMHEQYMTTLSSAHNGYLSLLAEVGLFGSLSLLFLTSLAYWRLFRSALRGDAIAMFGVSFVTGYLFLATFERFFLNMGNPTSALTWLFLMMPVQAGRFVRWPWADVHLRTPRFISTHAG
jgi:O-antigen ligase